MSACTLSALFFIDWIIGSEKAAVFPVPVRALAIRFDSPFNNRGIASIWIGYL